GEVTRDLVEVLAHGGVRSEQPLAPLEEAGHVVAGDVAAALEVREDAAAHLSRLGRHPAAFLTGGVAEGLGLGLGLGPARVRPRRRRRPPPGCGSRPPPRRRWRWRGPRRPPS